jgi:hypothetical protein
MDQWHISLAVLDHQDEKVDTSKGNQKEEKKEIPSSVVPVFALCLTEV